MRQHLLSPLAATLAVFSVAIPCPVAAQLRPLVSPPASAASALDEGVDVFLINEGRDPRPVEAPETIDTIARDGSALTLALIRSTADTGPVPAGGFAKLRYRLAPRGGAPSVAAVAPAPRLAAPETVFADARGTSSAIVERIRAYEPTYAALDDTGAKLQLSVVVRPFGGSGIASHLNVAYTQTVFWDVWQQSGPIRDLIYSPEIFFDTPLGATTTAAIGYRHDSNGGDLTNSVDSNRLFLRVSKRFPLGEGWQFTLSPQGWVYFGKHGIATDFARYFGYAALTASVEQTDGLKLSIFARGNPVTGRGAAELFLSYPVARFGLPGAGVYLFGEVYSGYGERLQNYNRADTHARLGFSLTR